MKAAYLITGVLALVGAILCVLFTLAAGAGWAYLLPAALAVILIVGGLPLSAGDPGLGAKLSGGGALVCALVLVAMIGELVHAIPFREQPGQASLLVGPGVLLVVSLAHVGIAIAFARAKQREA